MPVPVVFHKEQAEYVVECLKAGKPIAPHSGQWDLNEMLFVAGALVFAATSHGPLALASGVNLDELPAERREAIWQTFLSDTNAALQLYWKLTEEVVDGDYDAQYESTFKAVVGHSEHGDIAVELISGKK